MVCELSVFLLDNQNENGSFPCWFRGGKDELDNYDKIHSTWVCTQVCIPYFLRLPVMHYTRPTILSMMVVAATSTRLFEIVISRSKKTFDGFSG